MSALTAIILVSFLLAEQFTKYPLTNWIYPAVVFMGLVFLLVHYMSMHDEKSDPNKGIRKLMIASMLRLFLVVIFLGISLFNMPQVELGFVAGYIVTFLLFLFFDIREMRTKLRPDSEKLHKNSNV